MFLVGQAAPGMVRPAERMSVISGFPEALFY